ncbi:MAG TPA: guanine deaminase, partial [Casimicrobiaceae bacterium]|nr:guanine deaminase [Casimicrobiaceae bacterium]
MAEPSRRPQSAAHAPFALRGAYLTSVGDPFVEDAAATRRYEGDGMLVVAGGAIVDAGPANVVRRRLPPGTPVERLARNHLLVPGFVDCHVHYPQLPVIASHGTQLLDWLTRYTYPSEQALADPGHARRLARTFFDATLAAGTTTVASFCTVHPASADAFFAEAQRRGVRAIGGKVLMDRNAPAALTDTAQRGYDESKALIARWHGRGRLGYAITPRFAPTSTPAPLAAAAALWREHPTCWVQSHVSENAGEIAWVRELFPEARDYLDVYERAGLTGRRAVYGHGIHLGEREFAALAASGTALAHCPTSNLFLGSGLFPWQRAKDAARPVHVGLGTDVGGGTTLSMLVTVAEAYKVAQMGGTALSAQHLFHLATRGGAQALDLDGCIGSLLPGMEADFVELDLEATPLLAQRMRYAADLDDALFALLTLGDERAVAATWAAGRCVHRRDARVGSAPGPRGEGADEDARPGRGRV